MKIIETIGNIDSERHLTANIPQDVASGSVRVAVLPPREDENEWLRAVAQQWATELADTREDLYTLEDGYPLDSTR